MRKVIQIAVTPESQNREPIFFALCDDGTMWLNPIPVEGFYGWTKIPEIPQE